MEEKKFNPQDHLMDMRGKAYLEVKWRIVWFREEHPKGNIKTEIVSFDPPVMKAPIFDGDGSELGSGHGTPKTNGVAKFRPFEGAETAAIGRALATAGFGTQFTGEDEGEHLADAPIERRIRTAAQPAQRKPNWDATSEFWHYVKTNDMNGAEILKSCGGDFEKALAKAKGQ